MSEKIHEQISRLLDDDLPDEELDLLLKQLDKSPSYMQKAMRYQVVSNSINNGTEFTYSSTVLEKVRSHIDNEPNPIAKESKIISLQGAVKASIYNKAIKPALGAAIAASVAVVTVMTYVNNTATEDGIKPASTQILAENANRSQVKVNQTPLDPAPRSISSPGTISNLDKSGIATVSTESQRQGQPALVLDAQQWDRLPRDMRENVSNYINQHNNYQMVNGNTSRRIIIIEENVRR